MSNDQHSNATPPPGPENQGQKPFTSKKVSDHLANERTFLAWMRTGLATITFGFVIARFGLLVRELQLHGERGTNPVHYSSLLGISLTALGIIVILIALVNFLKVRQAIDAEQFHPPIIYATLLTIVTCVIGTLLAIYLLLVA